MFWSPGWHGLSLCYVLPVAHHCWSLLCCIYLQTKQLMFYFFFFFSYTSLKWWGSGEKDWRRNHRSLQVRPYMPEWKHHRNFCRYMGKMLLNWCRWMKEVAERWFQVFWILTGPFPKIFRNEQLSHIHSFFIHDGLDFLYRAVTWSQKILLAATVMDFFISSVEKRTNKLDIPV